MQTGFVKRFQQTSKVLVGGTSADVQQVVAPQVFPKFSGGCRTTRKARQTMINDASFGNVHVVEPQQVSPARFTYTNNCVGARKQHLLRSKHFLHMPKNREPLVDAIVMCHHNAPRSDHWHDAM